MPIAANWTTVGSILWNMVESLSKQDSFTWFFVEKLWYCAH